MKKQTEIYGKGRSGDRDRSDGARDKGRLRQAPSHNSGQGSQPPPRAPRGFFHCHYTLVDIVLILNYTAPHIQREKKEEKALHPSWAAKKQLKEKQNPSIVAPQGKKIVFGP